MDLLDNPIRDYAWGSRTAIAELLGRPAPSPGPEAELWLGAHPSAPSRVRRGDEWRSLLEVVEAAPERELGARVVAEHGARLPFLLKVLAAAEPLSLQAHPSAAQARAGFDDEERRRVPMDAPERRYKDRSHKPELLCALTPFEALCGFRSLAGALELLDDLGAGELTTLRAPLLAHPDARGVRAAFEATLALGPAERTRLVGALAAAARASTSERFSAERMADEYAALYREVLA